MALVVSAVITAAGRSALAKSFAGTALGYQTCSASYFKLGTGSFVDVSGNREPAPPATDITDIRSVGDGSFYYQKALAPADVTLLLASTIQITCTVLASEANGNPTTEPDTEIGQSGPKNSASLGEQPPEFFELGIFDGQGELIAHATFPGEVKLGTKPSTYVINIYF